MDADSYKSVRLLVSGGTIVFDPDNVIVGEFTFLAGGSITVTIPSGELKTDLAFTVDVDGSTEVNVQFDAGATFQNATATGSGKVILTPVLRN